MVNRFAAPSTQPLTNCIQSHTHTHTRAHTHEYIHLSYTHTQTHKSAQTRQSSSWNDKHIVDRSTYRPLRGVTGCSGDIDSSDRQPDGKELWTQFWGGRPKELRSPGLADHWECVGESRDSDPFELPTLRFRVIGLSSSLLFIRNRPRSQRCVTDQVLVVYI